MANTHSNQNFSAKQAFCGNQRLRSFTSSSEHFGLDKLALPGLLELRPAFNFSECDGHFDGPIDTGHSKAHSLESVLDNQGSRINRLVALSARYTREVVRVVRQKLRRHVVQIGFCGAVDLHRGPVSQ